MKIVFLFFAAINIAFFMWQSESFGFNKSRQSGQSESLSGVATLVLLEEADRIANANLKIKTKVTPKKTDTQTAMRSYDPSKPKPYENITMGACYALGPFDELAQAKPISNKIKKLGAHTYERAQKEKVTSGYWVYLPSFPSWKAARQKVVELEKKGMEDIFIMGRGKMKNAVSLGLFKNRSAADRRIGQLKRMGVKPKVEKQYSLAEKYWVEIDVEAGQKSVKKSVETIAKNLKMFELKKRPCN